MDLSIPYWALMAAGGLLAILELFIGSFVILWFGVGMFAVGILTLTGLADNAGLQLLLSGVLGGGLLIGFRDSCAGKGNGAPDEQTTFQTGTGKVIASTDRTLAVHINGTFWRLKNPKALPKHFTQELTVEVIRFEGTKAVIAEQTEAPTTTAIG